jgi:hypothetical protein
METTISVQGTAREKRGQPARIDVLREIAQLTRGELLEKTDAAGVAAMIAALPRPEPQERRVQLWAHRRGRVFSWCCSARFGLGEKRRGVFEMRMDPTMRDITERGSEGAHRTSGSALVPSAGFRVPRKRTFLPTLLPLERAAWKEVREGGTPSPALGTSALPGSGSAITFRPFK